MNLKGLLYVVLGIWLTMSTMSLTQLLPLNAYHLTLVRGFPAMVLTGGYLLFTAKKIPLFTKETAFSAIAFGIAALSLFQAILYWGASLSAVFLDLAVIVNFIFAASRGEKVNKFALALFFLAILGSALAVGVINQKIVFDKIYLLGLFFSIIAMIANGFFIETMQRQNQNLTTQVFWLALLLTIIGSVGSFDSVTSFVQLTPPQMLLALGVGLSTGLINFYMGFMASKQLPAVAMGLLVLGVTPTIITSTYLMQMIYPDVYKVMGVDQLVGVAISIAALAVYCIVSSRKTLKENK